MIGTWRTCAAAAILGVAFATPGSAGDIGSIVLAPVEPGQFWADPMDRINRALFHYNTTVGSDWIAPAVDLLRAHVPDDAREAAIGVVNNLEEPVTVVANLLAGDLEEAGIATQRFLINTFMGWMGIDDVAARHFGLERDPADLRKPLCRYGIPPGPIVVLPLFGEAHLRDLVGRYGTLVSLYEILGIVYIPYRVTTSIVRETEAAGDPAAATDAVPFERYEDMRARLHANADAHCD